jgi:hypothetical protein
VPPPTPAGGTNVAQPTLCTSANCRECSSLFRSCSIPCTHRRLPVCTAPLQWPMSLQVLRDGQTLKRYVLGNDGESYSLQACIAARRVNPLQGASSSVPNTLLKHFAMLGAGSVSAHDAFVFFTPEHSSSASGCLSWSEVRLSESGVLGIGSATRPLQLLTTPLQFCGLSRSVCCVLCDRRPVRARSERTPPSLSITSLRSARARPLTSS